MLRIPMTLILLSLVGLVLRSASAQWLHYPSPGIPRTQDGRPNLSAPAPRTPDCKPDLNGIWVTDADEGPLNEFGVRTFASNYEIEPEDIVLTPEGEVLQRRRKETSVQCLPISLAGLAAAQPFKIFSSKGVVVILYEFQTTYRQIFMDGRPLPRDPNPTWLGYSVGKWDGDTLVVDTTGFNDKIPLPGVRPNSEALHVIERFRRRDFGHLEIQYTIDDPKVYTKPWTVKEHHHLTPDTELLEYICNENEKDLKHMGGRDR